MKPTPSGWPRLSSSVFYDDPRAAIDWLCRAFGFELRVKVEGDDGVIHHSELCFGEALIMVGGVGGKETWQALYRSPQATGGWITQASALFVDARARREPRSCANRSRTTTAPSTGRTARTARSIRKATCGGSCSAFAVPLTARSE